MAYMEHLHWKTSQTAKQTQDTGQCTCVGPGSKKKKKSDKHVRTPKKPGIVIYDCES